jgi:hypothetical protein
MAALFTVIQSGCKPPCISFDSRRLPIKGFRIEKKLA